jgi:hypothetical protein
VFLLWRHLLFLRCLPVVIGGREHSTGQLWIGLKSLTAFNVVQVKSLLVCPVPRANERSEKLEASVSLRYRFW